MTDLEAAAEKAPLTGEIRSLLAWLGEGRKLTQTGRIGLADARYLVEFLSTGDQIDPEIGGRVFKTKSSEELAHQCLAILPIGDLLRRGAANGAGETRSRSGSLF